MEKVTTIFQPYKECARNLRNIYDIPQSDQDRDTLEDLDTINVLIFKDLVLKQFFEKYNDFGWFEKPFCEFKIVPSSDICPIMINRDKQSGY